MPGKHSTRLVIDASIAAAAGTTEHPTSKAHRAFLLKARKVCHKVVMTKEIEGEWEQHQSMFTAKWFASMESKRKVVRTSTPTHSGLRKLIVERAASASERQAMEKDAHLIEAALTTDQTVASADERARRAFGKLSAGLPELRNVVWVNPGTDARQSLLWLRWPHQEDPEWRLGAGS